MQNLINWAKKNRVLAVLGGAGVLIFLCCGCLVVVTTLFPSAPRTPTATPTATAARLATLALSTDTPPPTEAPTKTPLPTLPPTMAPTTPPTLAPTETPRPTAAATRAPTFTVIEFRSPVPVNGTARLVIRTTAGANCFINYRTPAGTVSDAQGLENKTADADGLCAWEWQIGQRTTAGTGTVIVSVNNYTESLPIVIQ